MAELPISTDDIPDAPAVRIPGSDFIRGAAKMPAVRQFGLLFAIAGAVALAVLVVLWMQTDEQSPLTTVHTPDQVAELTQVLELANIDYQLDHRTGTLLVPKGRLYEARMQIAGAQSVNQNQQGYELLDQEQGFGVSQFMENARHRRSVEGELARSIMTIQAVQHARVLLAVPKSTTFLRDRRKPSGSVTVALRSGHELSAEQIRGITNLVAGAVPELESDGVAVVDQTGRLLSKQDVDPSLEASERQLKFVAKLEDQLQGKVDTILSRMLGTGAYTAQVTAEVDFTKQEQASEQYTPQEVAVRSESTLEEERVGNLPVLGVPGTLTNQPPVEPAAPADPNAPPPELPRTVRNEATRNFEVDRTVSYVQQSVGRLSRLAVSVVVDHHRTVDAETGEVQTSAWTDEELEQLRNTVASAVGFSEARGDTVTVASSAFHQPELEVAEAAPFWAETWFIDLLKQVLGAIVLLLVLLLLLRPMYRSLTRAGEMVHERQAMEIADMNQAREQLAQSNALGLPSPEEGSALSLSPMVKMDTVKGLVANDPERVAEVVKHWVNRGE